MEQLLNQDPPIITPPERLKAFTMEVFSTLQAIYQAHAALLESLMKRQRDEWPLVGRVIRHTAFVDYGQVWGG